MKHYLQDVETQVGFHRALKVIFFLALGLRVLYILLLRGGPLEDDPHYYSLVARHLVEGQGYVELASRAYRPPGYPWSLAGIFKLFGENYIVARLVLATLGALACVFAAQWGAQLSTRRVGVMAGLMTAIYPQFVRYPQTLYSESYYMFLMAGGMTLLLVGVRQRAKVNWALSGIVFGLAALTREVTLLLPLVVALWLYLKGEWRTEATVRAWGIMCLTMALTVLPWTVRNYRVFGAFIPVTTNGGINFYIGNNPNATGALDKWELAPGVEWRDGGNELEAHRRGFAAGFEYVRQHPGRTMLMWGKKTWLLWRPPLDAFNGTSFSSFTGKSLLLLRLKKFLLVLELMFYVLNAALGFYGLWSIRHNWRSLALPLLLMLFLSIPFISTFVVPRFRVPLDAFGIFYAMIGLELLLRRRFALDGPPLSTATGVARQAVAGQF